MIIFSVIKFCLLFLPISLLFFLSIQTGPQLWCFLSWGGMGRRMAEDYRLQGLDPQPWEYTLSFMHHAATPQLHSSPWVAQICKTCHLLPVNLLIILCSLVPPPRTPSAQRPRSQPEEWLHYTITRSQTSRSPSISFLTPPWPPSSFINMTASDPVICLQASSSSMYFDA